MEAGGVQIGGQGQEGARVQTLLPQTHGGCVTEDVSEGELRCGILAGQSQLEGPQEKGAWAEPHVGSQ